MSSLWTMSPSQPSSAMSSRSREEKLRPDKEEEEEGGGGGEREVVGSSLGGEL